MAKGRFSPLKGIERDEETPRQGRTNVVKYASKKKFFLLCHEINQLISFDHQELIIIVSDLYSWNTPTLVRIMKKNKGYRDDLLTPG